ncbi:MAG: putative DEAD/DEAH box helicase domain protein [Parcubacteria group bacterium Gr01-1014_48]|nr:MAG: putative DEAD/DEAH box helicase domain protein [Parcubacteria group bacterium Greene0416_14]TSC73865.1 MAG: putative DEAD/DEAH box helicase domain protein [Parcubacteria group bacterium Gr01-1014_48]TSD01562.1 MAG: putative DEAD/DEAH box helicase domain protein [Parcubacteria group bacterium Greene1014_15]TSD08138.1 MAG: putative DEAD/DEAH box helicase domain protein [Parcubacteria group bacterium Greene0714_4]
MQTRNFRHTTGARTNFRQNPNRAHQKRAIKQLKHADITRFINKATAPEKVEQFVPTHRFSDFPIENRLKEAIAQKGYREPTPIQDKTIAHILRKSDVVGIANTGTGKTAAFLIPLIHKILTQPRERVLIMVPTRELAGQIAEELHEFAYRLNIHAAVCVGGASMGKQLSQLRNRPQFVIGTPGRLKDLLERRALNLSEFRTAVLDEADRMLDMGFIKDMRRILALLPSPRHTLFFSATFSPEIERLVGEFLHNPIRVSVKTGDTVASIEQDIVRVPLGTSKLIVLQNLLMKPEFSKVLIFGRTKHGVEKLSKILAQKGFRAESIHGNKLQGKRQKALDLFKRAHIQILVATDVAARGLDIDSISHVINYDLPASHEDYIHRIGRTGRAGKKGKALTFIEQT